LTCLQNLAYLLRVVCVCVCMCACVHVCVFVCVCVCARARAPAREGACVFMCVLRVGMAVLSFLLFQAQRSAGVLTTEQLSSLLQLQ